MACPVPSVWRHRQYTSWPGKYSVNCGLLSLKGLSLYTACTVPYVLKRKSLFKCDAVYSIKRLFSGISTPRAFKVLLGEMNGPPFQSLFGVTKIDSGVVQAAAFKTIT